MSSLVTYSLMAARGQELVAGQRVIEFGAGVGLAGLCVAAAPHLSAPAACVHLTNPGDNVAACAATVAANAAHLTCRDTCARRLAWQDPVDAWAGASYDVALLSDTLFKNNWQQLLQHVCARVRPGGTVVAVSPLGRTHPATDFFVYAMAERATMERHVIRATITAAGAPYSADFVAYILRLDDAAAASSG